MRKTQSRGGTTLEWSISRKQSWALGSLRRLSLVFRVIASRHSLKKAELPAEDAAPPAVTMQPGAEDPRTALAAEMPAQQQPRRDLLGETDDPLSEVELTSPVAIEYLARLEQVARHFAEQFSSDPIYQQRLMKAVGTPNQVTGGRIPPCDDLDFSSMMDGTGQLEKPITIGTYPRPGRSMSYQTKCRRCSKPRYANVFARTRFSGGYGVIHTGR